MNVYVLTMVCPYEGEVFDGVYYNRDEAIDAGKETLGSPHTSVEERLFGCWVISGVAHEKFIVREVEVK